MEDCAVASAGVAALPGYPPPPEVIEVMSEVGLDLSDHLSTPVSEEMVEWADVTLAMERGHLVNLAVLAPGAWRRCFTIRELLRRAVPVGERQPGQTVREWAESMSESRTRAEIMKLPAREDVADPIGGSRRAYQTCRDLLDGFSAEIAKLVAPS
ncbi:MAG: hypothetical protein ACRDYC_13050, partial [Acidimicrobiales bacterium]